MSEPEASTVETQVQTQRNFVIPGADVVIRCKDECPIAIEDLLAIVFQVAASNPGCKVDFWLSIKD